MVYAYKDNQWLGSAPTKDELERALKTAKISTDGVIYTNTPSSPPEPTTDEKIAALDAQYNADKADLLNAYQTAQIYGDTETMESLKVDLQSLDDQYDENYEKIMEEG